jgi:transposase
MFCVSIDMQDATIDSGALPLDVESLHRMIRELLERNRKIQNHLDGLQQQLELLLKRLYGPKSEKFNPLQLSLFEKINPPESTPDADSVPEPVPTPAPKALKNKAQKKGHGRREFPANLERKTTTHDLSEADLACPCCSSIRTRIGEEVSERLNFVPASLFVVRHVRIKYGCSKCLGNKAENVHMEQPETAPLIITAPPPASIIEKGLAEPGLLAHVIVSKYVDHLPLHRLEGIFKRQGVIISRSTMCDWMAACAKALTPIYDDMLSQVLKSKVIHCDETPVKVQAPGKTKTSRLWVYLGDPDYPYTIYDYRTTKARAGPEEILKGYKGFLHADAANVYDGLYLSGDIIEVACWAHARRYFHEALPNDAAFAAQALARIGGLYEVERQAKAKIEEQNLIGDAADDIRLTLRREKSKAQLAALKEWIDATQPKTLPKSQIGKAFAYVQRHWQALMRYTERGFLNIDNNAAERGFRPIALGRKNWLFVGSDNGGTTAAVLYSIVQTCREHDVEPWQYLKDVFTQLPGTNPDNIANLTPVAWKKLHPKPV